MTNNSLPARGTGPKLYVALGDSMTIDLYPNQDLGVPLTQVRPIGAASLLFQNDDVLWPEFAGLDLLHTGVANGLGIQAVDGAMLIGYLGTQLSILSAHTRFVTLTIGGNDLFFSYMEDVRGKRLQELVTVLKNSYATAVKEIHARAPQAVVVLSTVYDPSDGTGEMPGVTDLPLCYLHEFNDGVRDIAAQNDFARLADVHQHFLGYGVTASLDNCWYWSGSIIEPAAKGASEIRRCWVEALGIPGNDRHLQV